MTLPEKLILAVSLMAALSGFVAVFIGRDHISQHKHVSEAVASLRDDVDALKAGKIVDSIKQRTDEP